MRKWLLPTALAVVMVSSIATVWVSRSAADTIGQAATRLIRQSELLSRSRLRMISHTYESTTGTVTVTTNAGDQQDGEPTNLIDRHEQRLVEAQAKWRKIA